MRKLTFSLAAMIALALCAGSLQANFTLFDMAKDSMYIARGEFTSLERTTEGDRLTLRCDDVIKGDIAVGDTYTLEAFEPAPADEALGRDVIVCFNLVDGKHYFNLHPMAMRSFYFEDRDVASNGLDQNEQALRNWVQINEKHTDLIVEQNTKRLELGDAAYEGEYPEEVINEWKDELMVQMAWTGTWAARDAAKAFVDHDLFRFKATTEELRRVGEILPSSAAGSIGRAYMIELIRQEKAAHPSFDEQMNMLLEETSQACVGKLSALLADVDDRAGVLLKVGELATNIFAEPQQRINALQVLGAIKDLSSLSYVHTALQQELEIEDDYNKDVVRRAYMALRAMPDEASIEVIEATLENDKVSGSWELTQRAWVALATIDTGYTQNRLKNAYANADDARSEKFFKDIYNNVNRGLVIIHNED